MTEFSLAKGSGSKAFSIIQKEHLIMFFICLLVLLFSFVLKVERGQVDFPGFKIHLPSACLMKTLFKIECPFCGLSRSLVESAHLNFKSAISYNLAGPAFFLFLLLQIPYRAYGFLGKGLNSYSGKLAVLPLGLILLALFSQWLFKNFL